MKHFRRAFMRTLVPGLVGYLVLYNIARAWIR